MDKFVNIHSNYILVKDLTNVLDFDLINKQFLTLSWEENMYNSISKDFFFFNRDVFVDVKEKLEQECASYLRNAHKCYDFEKLVITNSWGNKTKENESHHVHDHSFSVVSGVIYLDDNPENLNFFLELNASKIPFYNSQVGSYVSIGNIIGTENNLKNHVILFLSNTNHGVNKVTQGSKVRRSVSFNTFWKGRVGQSDIPLSNFSF